MSEKAAASAILSIRIERILQIHEQLVHLYRSKATDEMQIREIADRIQHLKREIDEEMSKI